MTAATTRSRDGARAWRAPIAVLALYALVLQVALGGAAPHPANLVHAVLCLQQPDAGERGPDGSPAKHHDAVCCTVAPVSAALPAPLATAGAPAWPRRALAEKMPAGEPGFAARAPPDGLACPRAPPLA